jgi:surface protein
MSSMFSKAYSSNQPLADWDVSSVTDMRGMFIDAFAFSQPLADWDVSSVTDMHDMFGFAHDFNQSLADWNVSTDIDKSFLFTGVGALGKWDRSVASMFAPETYTYGKVVHA